MEAGEVPWKRPKIAYHHPVGLAQWLRNIFSSGELDDEAALREEYGLPERAEDEFQRDRLSSFTGAGESTAEEELEDHQPPRDPA